MASAARQDKSEDEEENGEERRPFLLQDLRKDGGGVRVTFAHDDLLYGVRLW